MKSNSVKIASVLASYASVKNGEKKAIVSGLDSDYGDLSLSCTSKVSNGKCQTWKPIEKRLNRVTFSLKFIAPCQMMTVRNINGGR